MRKMIIGIGVALSALSQVALAVANEWHWEAFGTGSYSGQVTLSDDAGNAMAFQRYGSGVSPQLFDTTSVQSPLVVVAGGKDFDVGIFQAGQTVPKKVCTAPEVWKVYVTPVTACNSGVATNIGGIHSWAENTAPTTWTPRLAVHVQGAGWRQINGHACGKVQAMQVCEE